MSTIAFPVMYINNPAQGKPIFNGQMYFGQPDLDPEIFTNQKQVYYIQENGDLVAASQPILLSAGGNPTYNGDAVTLSITGEYSTKVLNKLGVQEYYVARTDSSGDSSSVITYAEDPQTLVAGQLIVDFTGITVSVADIYVGKNGGDRGKLFETDDYEVTGGSQITLTSSFSAGTKLIAASSELVVRDELSQAYEFATLDGAIESTIDFPVGKVINTKERSTGNGGGGSYGVVLAASVTPNGMDIVACTGVPTLALVLSLKKIIGVTDLVSYSDPRQLGALQDGVTDNLAILQRCNEISDVLDGGDITVAIQGTILQRSFTRITNIKLKLLGDQSDYTIAAIINDNRAGTGNFGVECDRVEIIGFNTVQQIISTVITSSNGGVGGIYYDKCTDSTVQFCKTSDTWSGIVFTGLHAATVVSESNNKCLNNKVVRAQGYTQTGNSGTPRGIFFGTAGECSYNITNSCATGMYLAGDSVTATSNLVKDWYVDDGYYILGRDFTITNNRAVGNNFGNGFAIAYNENSIITNNHATSCSNMGFRIHCPQRDTIIANNRSKLCGYGFRVENSIDLLPVTLTSVGTTATYTTTTPHILVTGDFVVISGADQAEYNGIFRASAPNNTTIVYTMLTAPGVSTATGTIIANYTSQGMTIVNNHATQCDLTGIQLSFIVNSIVKNNICIENNKGGATLQTRGGLSLHEYCQDNIVKDNKCYDYAGVPTQTFGLYNYDKSISGAEVENTGNVFDHKSETGTDYFGAIEYANPRSETQAGSFTPELTPSGGGTISYALQEGRWHRSGNLVTAHIALQISSVSALSGVLQVLNMPFTASGGISQQTGTMNGYDINHNSGYPNITPIMLKNSTAMNFYVGDSGVSSVTLDAVGLLSTSQIYVTITYWIKN